MKVLNSVVSILICGELLAWLVHIHAMFHRYCTVHCKRMILREDTNITRMCILVMLPVSCTVYVAGAVFFLIPTVLFFLGSNEIIDSLTSEN